MHTCTFLPVKSYYRQVRLLYSFFKLVAMAAAGEKNGRLWVAPASPTTGLLLQRVQLLKISSLCCAEFDERV